MTLFPITKLDGDLVSIPNPIPIRWTHLLPTRRQSTSLVDAPILPLQPSVVHPNMSDADPRPKSDYYCHTCQKWHGPLFPDDTCINSTTNDLLHNDNTHATKNFNYDTEMVEAKSHVDLQPAPASTMPLQRDDPDDDHSQVLDDMPHSPPLPSLDTSLSPQSPSGNSSVELQTPRRDIWRREGPRPGPTVCPKDLEKRLSDVQKKNRLSKEIDRLSKDLGSVELGPSSQQDSEGPTLATVTGAGTGHPLSASPLAYPPDSPMDIDGFSSSEDDSSSVGHASDHGETTSQSLHSISEEESEGSIAGSDRSPSPAAADKLSTHSTEQQQSTLDRQQTGNSIHSIDAVGAKEPASNDDVQKCLRQKGWLPTWADVRHGGATVIDPPAIFSSNPQPNNPANPVKNRVGRPERIPFDYAPSMALAMDLHKICYKEGPWSDRDRGALVKGILASSETLQEINPWSKKVEKVVKKCVANCTRQTSQKGTVWLEEELSALGETIASGIRQGLIKIKSWCGLEWESLHRTVMTAVRQIFSENSRSLVQEKDVMKLFSIDFDIVFFQAHCGYDTNINGEKKWESVAHYKRKWEALAPLVMTKLPYLDDEKIRSRAKEMGLTKTYERAVRVPGDAEASNQNRQVPCKRPSKPPSESEEESEEGAPKAAKSFHTMMRNSRAVKKCRKVVETLAEASTKVVSSVRQALGDGEGSQPSGSGSSSQ